MRAFVFAGRNVREILRDPVNLAFGLGLPIVLLLLLSAIQARIPVPLFTIDELTPGIAVFAFSFLALFGGLLLATDRGTSFLLRLFASPLSAADIIAGNTLPLLPMALAQAAVCFGVAYFLGLPLNANTLLALLVLLPAALLYIGIGLLCGTLFSAQAVGGICGALLTNVSAWLSDTWFDLALVGGWFEHIAYLLPFVHAVEAGRAAVAGEYGAILPHLWWVIGYAAVVMGAAIIVFRRKMRSDAL